MIKKADMSNHCDGKRYRSFMFADVHQADAASGRLCRWLFKSNVRETWRVILVSKAGIFLSESLRMRSKSIQEVLYCYSSAMTSSCFHIHSNQRMAEL